MTPAAALAAALAQHLPADTVRVGVAVSGGGDSLACLVLLAEWAASRGIALHAATVDHRLRPGAAREAASVGELAARLGVTHDILTWQAASAGGNLQARARQARMELLSGWAAGRGVGHVCLGHTREDQAETVLLRLARGSGVDGLAAMRAARRDPAGPVWLRPLLHARRSDLRATLLARGLRWAEDPGNRDPRFDRVRARAVLAAPPLPGLDTDTLAETAERMQAAQVVLAGAARDAARDVLRAEWGAVRIDCAGYFDLPDDTRWRILSAALCRVSGQVYRPRLRALRAAEAAVSAGRRHALHGCLLRRARGALWVHREPAALHGSVVAAPGDWDSRWRIEGPADRGATMSALTPTLLAGVPDWQRAGVPRLSLLTTPVVRRGGVVVAMPVLDMAMGRSRAWRAVAIWDSVASLIDRSPD